MPEDQAIDPQVEAFLARLAPGLRPVAVKHGVKLFEFVLNVCQVNEDLNIMAQMIKARDAQERLYRLAQTTNNVATIGMLGHGWTQEMLVACRTDIDAVLVKVIQPVQSAIILPVGTVKH